MIITFNNPTIASSNAATIHLENILEEEDKFIVEMLPYENYKSSNLIINAISNFMKKYILSNIFTFFKF